MRPHFLSLLLLLVCGAGLVAAAEPDQRGPLRPMSDCLDPERARSWHMLDSDEVLVDAGRKLYLLRLEPSCPELTYSDAISFRSGNGVGRICGSVRDALIAVRPGRLGTRCAIASVAPLRRDDFTAFLSDRARGRVRVHE